MQIWLQRHAQPLVAPGLCYGQLDMAAEPEATRAAALTLAKVLPASCHVASSPLQRCEQLTQALLALRPDLTIEIDSRIAEMNFGSWEGRAWDAIGAASVQRWVDDFAGHVPGGGESGQQVWRRVAEALQDARARIARGAAVAWVTHAGVIRIAGLLARGVRQIPEAAHWPQDAPNYGCYTLLDLTGMADNAKGPCPTGDDPG